MSNGDADLRDFRQVADRYGLRYLSLYQFKSSSSQIPIDLPQAVKNAVYNLGNLPSDTNPKSIVASLFQIELTMDEAIYFLEYIGTMSIIKNTRSQLSQLGHFKDNLKESYLERQMTLLELASQMKLPLDLELLKLALGTTSPDYIRQELAARTLIATMESIEITLLELDKMEKDIRDNLITTIGLTAMSEERTPSATAIERLAEKYFMSQITQVRFYNN